jgi:hypothetical protein
MNSISPFATFYLPINVDPKRLPIGTKEGIPALAKSTPRDMVLCAPSGCRLAKNRIQPSGQAGIADLKVPSAHLNNQDQANFVVRSAAFRP